MKETTQNVKESAKDATKETAESAKEKADGAKKDDGRKVTGLFTKVKHLPARQDMNSSAAQDLKVTIVCTEEGDEATKDKKREKTFDCKGEQVEIVRYMKENDDLEEESVKVYNLEDLKNSQEQSFMIE